MYFGTGTQEVKKITRYNGLTKVELGPVATLDQVLDLFHAVRKLAVNQEAMLKTLEPPRLIFHTSSELDEHDLEIIKNYTDQQLMKEIERMTREKYANFLVFTLQSDSHLGVSFCPVRSG